MLFKDDEIEKKYFSISEVAEMLGVAASLIRFWESHFDTIKPRKNKNGIRQYTKSDIENLKVIYHLVKEKGYTLQGAKNMISGGKSDNMQDMIQVVEELQQVRSFLAQLRSDLSANNS